MRPGILGVMLLIVFNSTLSADMALFKEHLAKGIASMESGNPEEAVKFFESARGENPDIYTVHHALGIALLQQGFFYDAIGSFEKAVELKPGFAEGYFYIAVAYAQYLEDPLSAEEYYKKVIELSPDHARAYHGLGLIYLSVKKDPEKAIRYLEQAVEYEEEFSQGYFSLGLAYIMAGERAKVLGTISRLRQIGEENLAATLEAMTRGDPLQ